MKTFMTRFLTHIVIGLILLFATTAFSAGVMKNSDCLDCHSDKDLTKTNAQGKAVSLFVDEAKFNASTHKTVSCASCHTDLKKSHPDDNTAAQPVKCATCHERQAASYAMGAHGRALAAKNDAAPVCKDCHGTHEVMPPNAAASPLHFSRLTATCGECHPQQAEEVKVSVHGVAAAKGNRDAATCVDCHSEHNVQALKSSSALKISEDICAKCHASERINTKFSLPADVVKTFFESYHGLAAQNGSTKAANCASCHGTHKILRSSDPRSTIHPSNLVATCGTCHPGATAKFTEGKIHSDRLGTGTGDIVNRWARLVYLALIAGTIGFMLAHNGIAWFKKALAARRVADRRVLRMTSQQRAQHFLLLTSFIFLALTGFALKFPESWLGWLMGGEMFRSWSHRIAGVVLLAVGAYHLFYVAFTKDGRLLVKDLWPRFKDVADFFRNIGYLLGLTKQRARFGRFGYPEKMEYWAVVWGTIIMGATGLAIWLKMPVTRVFPRWIVDVATTIHYYEAILACLAIVVWHFYHVIFDPAVYPMNWAWLDGKVSEKWREEEHPEDHGAKQEPKSAAKE
jgi:formate dehydrogenase gamma subunit